MKVLIADGSPTIRGRLDSLLAEIPGVEITGHAGDGDEVFAQIRVSEPQIVILDSSLPPGGGLGLLRKLRSKGSTPVIIVITSFPNLQYRTKFHEAGAAYFFDKSKELDRLIEALVALKQELV